MPQRADFRLQPVAQRLYVVSDTRCPALLLFQDSGVRAGQRPQRADVLYIEHRGEFPYVQRRGEGVRDGLIMPQRADFRLRKPDFKHHWSGLGLFA